MPFIFCLFFIFHNSIFGETIFTNSKWKTKEKKVTMGEAVFEETLCDSGDNNHVQIRRLPRESKLAIFLFDNEFLICLGYVVIPIVNEVLCSKNSYNFFFRFCVQDSCKFFFAFLRLPLCRSMVIHMFCF